MHQWTNAGNGRERVRKTHQLAAKDAYYLLRLDQVEGGSTWQKWQIGVQITLEHTFLQSLLGGFGGTYFLLLIINEFLDCMSRLIHHSIDGNLVDGFTYS